MHIPFCMLNILLVETLPSNQVAQKTEEKPKMRTKYEKNKLDIPYKNPSSLFRDKPAASIKTIRAGDIPYIVG